MYVLLSLNFLYNRTVFNGACKVVMSLNTRLCMIRDHETAGMHHFCSVQLGIPRMKQHSVIEMDSGPIKAHSKTSDNARLIELLTDMLIYGVFFKEHQEPWLIS